MELRQSMQEIMLAALLVGAGVGGRAAAQSSVGADRLLPADAPVVLDVVEPSRQLAEFREYLDRIGLYESAAWAALQRNPGWAQARVGIFGVAGAAGMAPWEGIESLVGQDLALALLPGATSGSEPRLLAVAHLEEADVENVDRFLEQLNILAKVAPESIDEVSGGRIVRVNPELCYARIDSYLIVGNEAAHVTEALARSENGGGTQVSQAAPENARARLRVNLAALRQAGGPLAANEPLDNPLAGYLFGGWASALRAGKSLEGWLASTADGLTLQMEVDLDEPVAQPFASFFEHHREATAWRVEDLPRGLGEIRVDRDWARLFADREQILALPAANGVANFSAGITTLMGGLDFMDELLPRVKGPVRLVAAAQDFSDMERPPSPKFPAVALAVPLELGDDDVLRDRLQSAALGALTLIGLNQGQNQQPQLMTKVGTHRGHQVTYAVYAAPMPREQHEEGSNGDVGAVQYNFEPAVALVGDELIVATTYDLMKDIIDVKEAGGASPAHRADDVLWLDGGAAEQALRINTEELIINRMLEQNESREQATAMFEGLFQALRIIESAGLVSRATEDGVTVTLSIGLNDPAVRN
jgi:hypothetical protein